jgi:pullulanase
MVENNPTKGGPTGLDYIASLGITHLQLLPIYDFGGVDDVEKDSRYNWGYNPDQYMVPCGWYSKHPEDSYSRLNELLELIDECHKSGMRVVMDV